MAIALGCPSPAAPVRDDRLCAPGPGAWPEQCRTCRVGCQCCSAPADVLRTPAHSPRVGDRVDQGDQLGFPSRSQSGTCVLLSGCGHDSDSSSAGNSPSPGAGHKLRTSHGDRERAVDIVRITAGDGRLTAEELDERLEAALSARAVGELDALTADLPAAPGQPSGSAPPAEDLVRIVQSGGFTTRRGRWRLRSGWMRCWPKPGPRSTSPRR